MKKLFALVLALTMLVGLVACSDPAEAKPTEAKQETTAAPPAKPKLPVKPKLPLLLARRVSSTASTRLATRLGSSTKATLPRLLL